MKNQMAQETHPEIVSAPMMEAILNISLAQKDLLDAAKKGLFYGKPSELLDVLREATSVVAAHGDYPQEALSVLHAVLGLRTETDELIELILNGATRDDLLDEGGDVLFYLQVLMLAIDSSLSEACDKNVTKLRTRYPNGFDQARALSPDKAAEAEAMAQAG